MSESLAVRYRPKKFSDVVEQGATKAILSYQLKTGEIKNAYLFCGGAGTGKTTCARIFANEINHGVGVPIELDAASNNSVDDVRNIIQQAKTTSLDSEYKVFIMDEVHALSNSAWQAMLKILEEPPKKSIFIMCTTDPQKIPKTILSRVQRFEFQRISQAGIQDMLEYILKEETCQAIIDENRQALEYIAKLANGGMRDAITILDKCLSYTVELTPQSVSETMGLVGYDLLMQFVENYISRNEEVCLELIRKVYMSGMDLKLFIKQLTEFVLDIYKYQRGCDFSDLGCPNMEDIRVFIEKQNWTFDDNMLKSLIDLGVTIKWDTNPKARIEAWVIIKE